MLTAPCGESLYNGGELDYELGSSLYTLTTASAQVPASGQVAASSQVSASCQLAASCSCRVLSHQTLLWHHRLGHPSLLRLRSMHSCLLGSGLPRSLPPLLRSPAPPCLPCVKGRQRATPHSSEFPPTTTPLQTLHMDVWGSARVIGTDQERYFLLVVDDYLRYTTAFPLCSKQDLPVLRPHSDRGGEFSSGLLAEFCRDQGIRQMFTLPASPQHNGIAECRISLVMETLPTLRWTGEVGNASAFWVWGALSLVRDTTASKLSPRTLRCTFLGFPTDALLWQFYHPHSRRVLSSQDVTFDESVCYYRVYPHASHPAPLTPLFLEPVPPLVDPFPPQGSAPSGVSQVDPPPLDEPMEISSDSSGPAEGGDPAADGTATTRRSPCLDTPPGYGGDETRGVGSGGAATGGAETGGADTGGATSPSGSRAVGDPTGGPGVGQPSRLETLSPQQIHEWIVQRGRPGGGGYVVTTSGAAGAGATRGGAGAAGAGGAGATSPGGATGAGGAGAASPGGTAGAGGAGAAGTGCDGPASTRAGGAAGAEGATGATSAGGSTGAAGTGGASAGGARGDASTGGARAGGTGGGGAADGTGTAPRRWSHQSQPQLLPGSPLPTPTPHTEVTESLCERREPETRASTPIRARRVARPRPPAVPGTHGMALRPSSVPQRFVLTEPPASSLPHVPDPESDLARAASTIVTRLLAIVVIDPDFESTAVFALVAQLVDFAARSHLDCVTSLVTESESVCPPSVEGEPALGSDVLEDRQFELECLAAVLPRFASMLLCPEGDPDALDIPTPHSYAEAIADEYSSKWQTAMDVEMASWKSTGTYVDEVPPSRANIVDGSAIFRVKRPPGSPPAFKVHYVAQGFSQRQGVDYFQTFSPTPTMTALRVLLHIAAQRDYELHSLDFSTAFLQGSLHKEIWLRRPPDFTGSFPAGCPKNLARALVYGLCQAPHEWHDTLRTTLAALGFAPSSADPSLFLRTDTTLPSFYVLVCVDDLVFATADTEALALVKAELQERHTRTDLGELRSYLGLQITRDRARRTITLTQSHMVHQVFQRFSFQYSSPQQTPLPTGHSLSAPPSDESVEPSGPYPEFVGCLMYLMTCTRPDLAYPLSLLARYVAPVVLTGHSDASWANDQATQRSSQGYTFTLGSGSISWRSTLSSSVLGSSCEAEIYAGAMAPQELRSLTYLLTNLGERPRSPPFLYRPYAAHEQHRSQQLPHARTTAAHAVATACTRCSSRTRNNIRTSSSIRTHCSSCPRTLWHLSLSSYLNNNGGEFIGADFEAVLKKGIQHQLTVPYNPQQNGVAERFNRTLQKGARTLLGRAGLPDPFWVTALRQVALVKNRLLATVGDKQWVPYTKWYGSAPAVNMLRAYGCVVVFHVPKEKRGKLEASGRWGIHLGLAKDHKGWLIWDLTSQQLTVSRDVKFLESLYYKEWKQQQQKLPTTPLIIEADEVQRPSRQVQVTVSEEEISGVTEDGGEPEVVRAGSVAEQCDEDKIAHCYWAAVPEPKTLAEALSGPDAENWKQSVKEEYDSLLENETWELCELPPGKKAISSKLIFRHKYGPDGELTRYKSRLVAKGFQQTKGKDFDEIFAPVGKGTTLRVSLVVAANRGWRIKQMDITTAFLNGIILEELYMLQPEGLDDGSGRVCKLKKAIYGLKQAPRAWYHKLEETLLAGGFKKTECDHSLFLLQEKEQFSMLLVYVDDILLFSESSAMIERVEEMLEMQFKKYCEGLAEKYGLQDGGKPATPLPSGFTVEPCADEEVVGESDRKLFHSMVGALNYAANHTRPDIAFATSRLASVVSRPSHEQLEAAKRLVRYVSATASVGLEYSAVRQRQQRGAADLGKGEMLLTCYTDASFNSVKADGTSIGGYVCMFGGGAVSWRSKKQNEVGLSSCETVYMALHHGVKEVVWLSRLLEEISVFLPELPVLPCPNSVPHAALPALPHALCPTRRAARLLPSARLARCPAHALPCPALCLYAALPYGWRAALPCSPLAALPCSPRAVLSCSPRAALPCSPRAALPYSPHAALPCSPRAALPYPAARVPPCPASRTPCSPRAALPCSQCVALPCNPRAALASCPHALQPARCLAHTALQPARCLARAALQPARCPALQPVRCPATTATTATATAAATAVASDALVPLLLTATACHGHYHGRSSVWVSSAAAAASAGDSIAAAASRVGARGIGVDGGGGARAAGAGGAAAAGAGGAGAAGAGGARDGGAGAAGAGVARDGGAGGTGAASAGGTGAAGAGGAGAAGAGGAATAGAGAAGARGARAGGVGGTGATGAGGTGAAGAGGAGAACAGGAGAAGAGGTGGPGGARAGGAGGTGAVGAGGTGDTGATGAVGAGDAGAGGTGGVGAGGAGGAGVADGTGTAPRRLFFYPLPSSTGFTPPLLCPSPDQSQPQLLPGSPLPAPSPYPTQTGSLAKRREPESHPASPVRTVSRARRSRSPPVPSTHTMALRPSSVPQRVALPSALASSLHNVPDPESDLARAASPTITRLLATVVTNPSFESTAASALVNELVDFAATRRLDYDVSLLTESQSVSPLFVGGELSLGCDVLEDILFELECLAAVLPRFASMLFCPEGGPDALDIPTLSSFAEAVTGEYSSQWQTAMDAEVASWKSTGTYVYKVPPPGAKIVDGMWISRVKRPPGSPPAFKAHYCEDPGSS
ncbi:unnamed protein product [Closterium sp. NIES-54]